MAHVDSGLKEAIWLLLEITSHQQPGQTIHSDFVIRKFPKINEIELLNAIGGLVQEGKITVKASSVDAHGNATAYHIRMKGQEAPPAGAEPSGGVADYSVGFGGTKTASTERATKEPEPPKKVGLSVEGGKIGITPDTGGAREVARPAAEEPRLPQERVTIGPDESGSGAAQQQAEEHFADEVASFFSELASAPTIKEEDKKALIDQLAVLMAMFQSADAEAFTTPIAKLASLKARVHLVAPELVPDYILLCQTALRAWLGRV
jgi:hypothetical protein